MIEVYEEKSKPEPVVRLKLRSNADGSVTLLAVDAKGERLQSGSILMITSEGNLWLLSSVNVDGIQTDKDGYIIREQTGR